MDASSSTNVVLELTPDEAAIVAAALRQFEPYWPFDATEQGRNVLLAEIRRAIDGVTRRLVPA
jgi:hypothetical protein